MYPLRGKTLPCVCFMYIVEIISWLSELRPFEHANRGQNSCYEGFISSDQGSFEHVVWRARQIVHLSNTRRVNSTLSPGLALLKALTKHVVECADIEDHLYLVLRLDFEDIEIRPHDVTCESEYLN